MARMDDADVQANATEICAIARRPASKTAGAGNCLLCGEYIPARTMAKTLPGRRMYAHVECTRQLLARLDAAPCREPQPAENELPFGDGAIEVD